MRLRFPIFALTILICTVVRADDPLPIPDETAQKDANELVQEVYGDQIKAATNPDQKLVLVRTLLKQAARPDTTDAGRYALLRTALDVAPDAYVAMSIVETMAASYTIDKSSAKAYTIKQMSESATTRSQHKGVAESAMNLADEYVDFDNFAAANILIKIATDAAQQSSDIPLIRSIRERSDDVAKLQRWYAEVKTASAILETNPTDAKSNLVVGKYECFAKGHFQDGLPMLALGDDEALSKLATVELTDPKTSNEQVALGDGWSELAQSSTANKQQMLERAKHWYQLSLKSEPVLSVLEKGKVEKRLAEIVADDDKPPPGPSRELTIVSAKYGAGDGWLDVMSQVKARLQDSRLVMPRVGTLFPDAKFGQHKALVMVVAYDVKYFSLYVPADEAIVLPITPQELASKFKSVRMKQLPRPDRESKFDILDAQWGAYNGWLDVTPIARKAVKDSKLKILNAGRGLKDPAFGHYKALVIVYAVDGQIQIATVPDGGATSIP